MLRWSMRAGGVGLALLLVLSSVGQAYDAAEEFAKGTRIFSFQLGGGGANNVEGHDHTSGATFLTLLPRLSLLPLDPMGSGLLRGAVDVGLEGWFQYYLAPQSAEAGGLKGVLRYHFLHFGRLVPYVELTGGAGASTLEVKEIRSTLTFIIEAGAGLSYVVAPGVAVTGGYRFQHLSNGNVEPPNRGINSDTGVLGVSFFFH